MATEPSVNSLLPVASINFLSVRTLIISGNISGSSMICAREGEGGKGVGYVGRVCGLSAVDFPYI